MKKFYSKKEIEIEKKRKEKILEIEKEYNDLELSNLEKNYFLEIYIKFIETAENTSKKRILINTGFYLPIITLLISLSLFSLIKTPLLSFGLSSLILLLSFTWKKNINYFKNINSSKFDIMKIMSKKLIRISVFDDEYQIFNILNGDKERLFSSIEKIIPCSSILIASVLLIFSLFFLFL